MGSFVDLSTEGDGGPGLQVDAAGDTLQAYAVNQPLVWLGDQPFIFAAGPQSGDIATVWTGSRGDWAQAGSVLASGQDLRTAAIISLFTDAQASPDDAIPDAPQRGPADPRGWWGDAYSGKPIGSKLWLLARAKQTQGTLNLAQDAIQNALQWMVDDGVAVSIDVATTWLSPSMLGAAVEIFDASGGSVALNFQWAWQAVGVA